MTTEETFTLSVPTALSCSPLLSAVSWCASLRERSSGPRRQGRVLRRVHGVDARAGERGLDNRRSKDVERARGTVDADNDVSGGLHDVVPAFCRDLMGTWTTSWVTVRWWGLP